MKPITHHVKHISKRTGKLFFPYIWHYFTDDYKGKFHHLIVDSVLSLIILTLIVINFAISVWFYFFLIPPEFQLKLSTHQDVISGTELTLQAEYMNVTKPIKNVRLKLFSPRGYAIDNGQAEFLLPSLITQEQGAISIPGYFVGNVRQHYRFIMIYEYDYYGQHYSGLALVPVNVATTSLEVVPTLPEKVLKDEPVQWKIEYTNSSNRPRNKTCFELGIPDTFAIESSTQTIADKKICFDKMEARASGSIEINGTFTNALGEGAHLVSVTTIDSAGEERYVQSSIENPILVLTPRINLATSGPEVVNVGEIGKYTQSYTNTGDAPLRNVTVKMALNDFEGKYSSLNAYQGIVSGNTITWVDPVIEPGATHYKTLAATINPALREKNVQVSYNTSAVAEIDDLGITTYTRSIGKNIKFNSTLNFQTVQKYYSSGGDQLGYGPYPMEADNITAVRVFWQIKDFTNDLSNVTIQTTLPSQVEWTNLSSVTAGSAISYNPANRTVTWHTSSIPSFSHEQGAQFEVRVRPNSQQIGKVINITNETRFSAQDSFTGVVISRTNGAVRTDKPVVKGE